MSMLRNSLLAAVALTACLVSGPGTAAAAAETPRSQPYDAAMVTALATSLGVSDQVAADRLDDQNKQQARLASLTAHGLRTGGAFFDAKGALTVNVTDAAARGKVEAAGLKARIPAFGEAALKRVKASLDTLAAQNPPTGIASWEVDLASDTVTVKETDGTTPAARAFLAAAARHGKAVRTVGGQTPLAPQMVVSPGSEMTFGNYLCSVGFGAHDRTGKQYLVTAGHCIESLPELYASGTRFAVGTNSRFHTGGASVDMGIAELDAEDSIATQVTTYGAAGSPAVQGSTRALPGAAMCKSGRTTHWTCGAVSSYNVTVTYTDQNGGPSTVVSGLGSSTVCTQGGDSGGAYISGTQAQGMTSGGPIGQVCNGGTGQSYFQPLDNALSYYGLTLNTQ